LRLRIEQIGQARRIFVTHKGPRAHGVTKTRAETEAQIVCAEDGERLLSALGYHRVLSFEKRRRRWRLDGCRVELDRLPHLGNFIEIEGPSEEAVLEARNRLDLADEPLIQASYIAMLMTHLAEQGIRERRITF
jgi:predicted adenylyl cyclase CyaB